MCRLRRLEPILGLCEPGSSHLLGMLLRPQVAGQAHLTRQVLEAGQLDSGTAHNGALAVQLRS